MAVHCWILLSLVVCNLINFTLVRSTSPGQEPWGYIAGTLRPSQWTKLANAGGKFCDSWRQSPINIKTGDIVYDKFLKAPEFVEVQTGGGSPKFKILNDGHKILVKFDKENPLAVYYNNERAFCPDHVHFHWGLSNNVGSEHTIDGVSSPMEAHIVSWNCKRYQTFQQALKSPDGLGVFGIMFEVVPESINNTAKPNVMEIISQAITNSTFRQAKEYHKRIAINIPFFDIAEMLPNKINHFYRYAGSLTTPPCTENVIWTLFKEKKPITQAQLNRFRNLLYPGLEKLPMVNNFRPVMPLNANNPMGTMRFVSYSTGYRTNNGLTFSGLVTFIVVAFITTFNY